MTGSAVFDIDAIVQKWWEDLTPGPDWPPKDQFLLDTSGINVELLSFNYDTPNPIVTPNIIASSEFDNGTDVQDSQLFSNQQSTTASFMWSITEGLKVGAKTTFKVGTPVLEGGVEVSAEISFGATQAQTTTTTQTWSWSTGVNVPPRSKIVASVVVNQETYSTKFTAVFQLSGMVGYRDRSGTHAGGQGIAGILQNLPGVDTVYGDSAWGKYPAMSNITVRGTFTGVQGNGYHVQTTQSPLPGGHPAVFLT